MEQTDYLIIGGGIIGLTLARTLKNHFPNKQITLIEKEPDIAAHASGRNSGVIHAGFYYTANSLKAKLTKKGNQLMHEYCTENGIAVNRCGKIVVATTPQEVNGLEELKRRADINGVHLDWLTLDEMTRIEPNAFSVEKALFSPTTSSVDPKLVCHTLYQELGKRGVKILTKCRYLNKKSSHEIITSQGKITTNFTINCAGLYADKIAKDFGFSQNYVLLPFKGIYLKYTKPNGMQIRTNIYPVPNLANPFLGVHFTKLVDGSIKIGPTAIPTFWRENYTGINNFNLQELTEIGWYQAQLFIRNSFDFRALALSEIKKYHRQHFCNLARKLVKNFDASGFTKWCPPGIRAQLIDIKTYTLVQDFLLEGDNNSLHVLNAVSPAFTCAFPMADIIVSKTPEVQ